MKNLSQKLKCLETEIDRTGYRSVSFDIDGTLYPILYAELRWWREFIINPQRAWKFLRIRKTWEKRRLGNSRASVIEADVRYFEDFLSCLLNPDDVPVGMRQLLVRLGEKKIKTIFLSDHGAMMKLRKLRLNFEYGINCLEATGELKPHQKISEYLIKTYSINPEEHLHVGDRWSDEAQARLLGCHFFMLKL